MFSYVWIFWDARDCEKNVLLDSKNANLGFLIVENASDNDS